MRINRLHEVNTQVFTAEELKAIKQVPICVKLDEVRDFDHVIFRVEHPVILYREGEEEYSRKESNSCMKWLEKFAPKSKYAAKKNKK